MRYLFAVGLIVLLLSSARAEIECRRDNISPELIKQSAEDFAASIVEELETRAHLHERITVAY